MSNNTRTRPFIAILACVGSFLLSSSLHAAPAPSAPESKASVAFPAEGKFCLCYQESALKCARFFSCPDVSC